MLIITVSAIACVGRNDHQIWERWIRQFYALIYRVVDDYITRRAQYREKHLQLAQEACNRGELILGGAFADPSDQALLIFRVAERSVIENFVNKDPYVINGLVTKWEIRPWTVVIGKEKFEG